MQSENVFDKRKQALIVISLAFASFMGKLDGSIVNISLPAISDYFKVSTSEVSWVILIYLIFLTSTLIIVGKIADSIGLKKIFIIGYVVFVISSFLCGFIPVFLKDIWFLILFRSTQGIGGSMIMTTAFAIIPKHIPKERLGWAYGLLSIGTALGLALGAPLGGIITGFFSWEWIFFINVPIGLIAIIIAIRIIPSDKVNAELNKETKFDYKGSILSFLGILILIYAINSGTIIGWLSPIIIISFLLSGLLIYIFITREKKIDNPLLDLKLFKDKNYSFAIAGTFLGMMLISGCAFLLPFYLEGMKDLSTEMSGLIFMIFSLAFLFGSPVSGKLSDKYNPTSLCRTAMLTACVSTIFFAFTLGLGGLLYTLSYLIILGISYSLFVTPNSSAVMSLAPENERGSSSAIYIAASNFSQILGVAILESIFAGFFAGNAALNIIKDSKDIAVSGFRYSFIVGALICFLAFFVLNFSKIKKSEIRKDEIRQDFI